ncbi:MAG: hypothetical protein A7315_08450 [Candidatus Altiarchaeales archaeon WOR_SM1_79]|nr:MAG: hypothetical protein A7315_08450 [Candidatus Altiarchaeales archaeon WOR_SM1_79]
MNDNLSIKEIIEETKAYNCMQCAKCTSICPISRVDERFSPRLIAEKVLLGFDEVFKEKELWTCLTCAACNEKCPSGVDYTRFIRELRARAQKMGEMGTCAHGGAIQSIMRTMSNPNLSQNRLQWLSKDMKIASKGKILYFVGCLPYFDIIFEDIGVNPLKIARSAIRIFNHLGIEPVLMKDERCCGHDLLWSGDVENFEKLAKINIELIKETGAELVITTCPECYRTLKLDYSEYLGEQDFEIIHLSEFLSDLIEKGELEFDKAYQLDSNVTYQDPCRLGRHLGVYDQPRKIIDKIPGMRFSELESNREGSVCCGSSCWINCGQSSKEIQIEKLREAKSTADLLITACPKCQIHLKCAMVDKTGKGPKIDLEIEDLTVLTARALGYLI